jgi:hypothetical protein
MSGPHLVIYTMVKDNTTWKVSPHNLHSLCVYQHRLSATITTTTMTTATTILQVLEGTLAECQKHIAFYTLETSAFEVF